MLKEHKGEQILHIGQGSNLLFTKDFDGSIVHPVFTGIEVVEQAWDAVVLRVAAGEKLGTVVHN